jgi:hypothetical protein
MAGSFASSTGDLAVMVQDEVLEHGFVAPEVRWEPCTEAAATDEFGLCAGCGWPPQDHLGDHEWDHGDEHGVERRGAIVIPVPERPRLRRAS